MCWNTHDCVKYVIIRVTDDNFQLLLESLLHDRRKFCNQFNDMWTSEDEITLRVRPVCCLEL